MTISADPDQLASEEANWSGSALFAKARYVHKQLFFFFQRNKHDFVQ